MKNYLPATRRRLDCPCSIAGVTTGDVGREFEPVRLLTREGSTSANEVVTRTGSFRYSGQVSERGARRIGTAPYVPCGDTVQPVLKCASTGTVKSAAARLKSRERCSRRRLLKSESVWLVCPKPGARWPLTPNSEARSSRGQRDRRSLGVVCPLTPRQPTQKQYQASQQKR